MCVSLAASYSSTDPIFEILKIVLPSSLVVVGWIVAYALQNHMAHNLQSRKDIRDGLTLLKSTINNFNECYVEYCTNIDKSYLAVCITSDFDAISKDVLRAAKNLPIDSSGITDILVKIAMSLTGGDFQTKRRSKKDLLDSNFAQAADKFNLILTMLEDGYHEKFGNT